MGLLLWVYLIRFLGREKGKTPHTMKTDRRKRKENSKMDWKKDFELLDMKVKIKRWN